MQIEIIYLIAGIFAGGVIAWVIATQRIKSSTISKTEYDALLAEHNTLKTEIGIEKEKSNNLTGAVIKVEEDLKTISNENIANIGLLASKTTECSSLIIQLEEIKKESIEYKNKIDSLRLELISSQNRATISNANLEIANATINKCAIEIGQLKTDLHSKTNDFNETNKKVSELTAVNDSYKEKLETQKKDIEALHKQFNVEFENIANRVLKEKTSEFTETNKTNLESLLKPLGDNINLFKVKVEEVYDKESKERFSLGREVERLVQANQRISDEANNLTKALTTNSKSQGDWGQIILESILEKSGLAKGQQYFVQEFLKDDNGNYLINEEGNKMQPDVIVSYPDNRKVIIDSKVSLTAYTRYTASTTKEGDSMALIEHLKSIRKHIDDLSSKNYQDFAPSLDFVMLFVPVEPAYLLAINNEQDLWSYAYKKRILLTSPSNLIVALRMIVDLWKRDNQSKNHLEIAERGGKLYDKFYNLLLSFRDIGKNLKATQISYNTTINRLAEGNNNVLRQVEKLKTLGASAKKSLPDVESLMLIDTNSTENDITEEN